MSIKINHAIRLRDAIQRGDVDEWDVASIMEFGWAAWVVESDSAYALVEREVYGEDLPGYQPGNDAQPHRGSFDDGTERIHWGDCFSCGVPFYHEGEWDDRIEHDGETWHADCLEAEQWVQFWTKEATR